MSRLSLLILLMAAVPAEEPPPIEVDDSALDEGVAPAEPVEVVFDEGVVPAELEAIARSVRDRPLGERMKAVSEPLLGRHYAVDAVGEGVPPDDDPPARYDVFDCLTFVEEILALTLPADPISAPLVRNGLRYDGEPTYEHRRHFMMAEWIPHNVAAGWLTDITAQLGQTHLVEKDITPGTWRSWRRRKLFALSDDQLPTGHFTLPVLSLDAALEAADRIPPGALVVTVRRNNPGVPIVVTHIGFTVPSDDGHPRMRHATRMGDQVVKDHKLSWYFEHVRWYDRWAVEGINVLMPREMGPRMARLDAPVAVTAGGRAP